jgi:hypothetical protein
MMYNKNMYAVVPQHYKGLICPNCKTPAVYIDVYTGAEKQKSVPVTQKQPYCLNCGFTAETTFAFIKGIPSKNVYEAKAVGLEVWKHLEEHPEISKKADLPKELSSKVKDLSCMCPDCPAFRHVRACPGCPFIGNTYRNLIIHWANSHKDSERKILAASAMTIIQAWDTEETETAKAEIADIAMKYSGIEAMEKVFDVYSRFENGG